MMAEFDVIDLPITDQEMAAIKQSFDMYDLNKDGHITSSELAAVLKSLGQNPTHEEIQEFIRETDKNNNGTIEFIEFCNYLLDMRRDIFNEIDADKDGYITAEEMKEALKKFGNEITLDVARQMVRDADSDNDGRVSYVEFICAMQDVAFQV